MARTLPSNALPAAPTAAEIVELAATAGQLARSDPSINPREVMRQSTARSTTTLSFFEYLREARIRLDAAGSY